MKSKDFAMLLFCIIFLAVIIAFLASCGTAQPAGTGRFGDKVTLFKSPPSK